MSAYENLKKAFKDLENREKVYYEKIMLGEYLPVDKLILHNEKEIVWNFKKEKLLKEDCPQKFLIEITVNTQSHESHFKDVVAYTVLRKNYITGPLGRETMRRMWIADKLNYGNNFKVDIASIEVGKESKLWKR